MTYQFWKHRTGDVFAVTIKDGNAVLISEALHHTEVYDSNGSLVDPSELNFDTEFDGNENDYYLVED